jgi:class 3 adenylate cyclase
MSLQRKQHKRFIADIASKFRGIVFEEEGDAYWMEFPSVTDAVLSAIDMHQGLHTTQAGRGEKKRLAIRAVITVGDIVHQGVDTMGMTMSLTARMEKFTPPDEIYLSHAAWLLLNKAEIQTSFVGEFPVKGFSEPEKIYKVDQKHRARVITDQWIVFTDIKGWTNFIKHSEEEAIESILYIYDDLINEVCDKHNGVIRNTTGDTYFLTFTNQDDLFAGIDELSMSWKYVVNKYQLGISVSIHKGNLNVIRSYLYGEDINTTVFLQRLLSQLIKDKSKISIITSQNVKTGTTNTNWESRFSEISREKVIEEWALTLLEQVGGYWFAPTI